MAQCAVTLTSAFMTSALHVLYRMFDRIKNVESAVKHPSSLCSDSNKTVGVTQPWNPDTHQLTQKFWGVGLKRWRFLNCALQNIMWNPSHKAISCVHGASLIVNIYFLLMCCLNKIPISDSSNWKNPPKKTNPHSRQPSSQLNFIYYN